MSQVRRATARPKQAVGWGFQLSLMLLLAVGIGVAIGAKKIYDHRPVEVNPRYVVEEDAAPRYSEPVAAAKPPEATDTPTRGPGAKPGDAGGNPFLASIKASSHRGRWNNDRVAIDRISAEIVETVQDGPLLAVWIFDATPSATQRRREWLARFNENAPKIEKIAALQADEGSTAPPLLTVVGAMTSHMRWITAEPTRDPQVLKQATDQINEIEDSEEKPFSAVIEALEKYSPLALRDGRRLMIILATDEAGDDENRQDEAVNLARKLAVPIWAVGVPAPFQSAGSLTADVFFEGKKPVRQGPESRMLELPDYDFMDARGIKSRVFDSGYGPFGLSRLCSSSGGQYLAVRPSETGVDFTIMSRYAPDYVSEAGYNELLNGNKACMALHQAISVPKPRDKVFMLTTFANGDPSKMKNTLDQAQRVAAVMTTPLQEIHKLLASGESDRPRLTSPRWRAHYDLSMGRILAARARIEGYNSFLAQLKAGRKLDKPEHTMWVLQTSSAFGGDSALEKLGKQARQYLERVTHEHPNTPWAQMAFDELAIPIGWEWASR